MIRVRDEDRRRQAARMAAHHTLELENAQNVLCKPTRPAPERP